MAKANPTSHPVAVERKPSSAIEATRPAPNTNPAKAPQMGMMIRNISHPPKQKAAPTAMASRPTTMSSTPVPSRRRSANARDARRSVRGWHRQLPWTRFRVDERSTTVPSAVWSRAVSPPLDHTGDSAHQNRSARPVLTASGEDGDRGVRRLEHLLFPEVEPVGGRLVSQHPATDRQIARRSRFSIDDVLRRRASGRPAPRGRDPLGDHDAVLERPAHVDTPHARAVPPRRRRRRRAARPGRPGRCG